MSKTLSILIGVAIGMAASNASLADRRVQQMRPLSNASHAEAAYAAALKKCNLAIGRQRQKCKDSAQEKFVQSIRSGNAQ